MTSWHVYSTRKASANAEDAVAARHELRTSVPSLHRRSKVNEETPYEGLVMKLSRSAMAALAALAALTVCTPANAQSALIPYALQTDPAIPDVTTRQQQEEVMSLFTAHVGLWLTRDPERYPYERLITEDALFEYPYADAESGRQIQGRRAVAEMLRALPRAAVDWKVDDVKLFQTAHSDVFFVSYNLSTAEHPYGQGYMARITVRNGQIANYYELWDRNVTGATSAATAHK